MLVTGKAWLSICCHTVNSEILSPWIFRFCHDAALNAESYCDKLVKQPCSMKIIPRLNL